MKKIIPVILLIVYIASFGTAAFAEPLAGGWQTPDSPDLTPEAQAAFERATEGTADITYKPLALLGTQIVSGKNYSILCEAADASSDAEPYYVRMTVYEDLNGTATVTAIENLETHTTSENAAFADQPLQETASENALIQEIQPESIWQKIISSLKRFFTR